MHSLKPAEERRQSLRHHLYHIVKMQIVPGTAPRECLILDISDEGVRIYVVGFDVPDEFVLHLSGDSIVKRCKVTSRRAGEVGVKFISQEPPRAAQRDLSKGLWQQEQVLVKTHQQIANDIHAQLMGGR